MGQYTPSARVRTAPIQVNPQGINLSNAMKLVMHDRELAYKTRAALAKGHKMDTARVKMQTATTIPPEVKSSPGMYADYSGMLLNRAATKDNTTVAYQNAIYSMDEGAIKETFKPWIDAGRSYNSALQLKPQVEAYNSKLEKWAGQQDTKEYPAFFNGNARWISSENRFFTESDWYVGKRNAGLDQLGGFSVPDKINTGKDNQMNSMILQIVGDIPSMIIKQERVPIAVTKNGKGETVPVGQNLHQLEDGTYVMQSKGLTEQALSLPAVEEAVTNFNSSVNESGSDKEKEFNKTFFAAINDGAVIGDYTTSLMPKKTINSKGEMSFMTIDLNKSYSEIMKESTAVAAEIEKVKSLPTSTTAQREAKQAKLNELETRKSINNDLYGELRSAYGKSLIQNDMMMSSEFQEIFREEAYIPGSSIQNEVDLSIFRMAAGLDSRSSTSVHSLNMAISEAFKFNITQKAIYDKSLLDLSADNVKFLEETSSTVRAKLNNIHTAGPDGKRVNVARAYTQVYSDGRKLGLKGDSLEIYGDLMILNYVKTNMPKQYDELSKGREEEFNEIFNTSALQLEAIRNNPGMTEDEMNEEMATIAGLSPTEKNIVTYSYGVEHEVYGLSTTQQKHMINNKDVIRNGESFYFANQQMNSKGKMYIFEYDAIHAGVAREDPSTGKLIGSTTRAYAVMNYSTAMKELKLKEPQYVGGEYVYKDRETVKTAWYTGDKPNALGKKLGIVAIDEDVLKAKYASQHGMAAGDVDLAEAYPEMNHSNDTYVLIPVDFDINMVVDFGKDNDVLNAYEAVPGMNKGSKRDFNVKNNDTDVE